MHFAAEAAAPGADFASLAVGPGAPSGHYQRHLNSVLPDPGPLCFVSTPLQVRGQKGRHEELIPMNPPREALTKEAMENPSFVDAARAAAWPPSYETTRL